MSRRLPTHDNAAFEEAAGRDSFLDVIANVAAVLVLLVILLGLRATFSGKADVDDSPIPPQPLATDERQLEQVYEGALTSREDIAELIEKAAHVRQDVLAREEERTRLTTYISAFAGEVEKRRANLDQQKVQDEQLRTQIANAQRTLDELSREQMALLSAQEEVKEIVSSPLAMQVRPDAKRVHLRMSRQHISAVPVEQALGAIVEDLKKNQDRLHDRFTNTIGPIGGYWIRYRVAQREISRRSADGQMGRGAATVFDGAQFTPAAEPFGEPLETALLPDSELMRYMGSLNPESTSVVVTLYTNNFGDYLPLKEKLQRMGFSVAVHTRQEGELFSVSPRGQDTERQ